MQWRKTLNKRVMVSMSISSVDHNRDAHRSAPMSNAISSASSTPTSSLTWITWFCSLPGHEYFCEVSEEFIEDDFNLTGLNALVPYWREAMEMVLDVEPGKISCSSNSPRLHRIPVICRRGLLADSRRFTRRSFCGTAIWPRSSKIYTYESRPSRYGMSHTYLFLFVLLNSLPIQLEKYENAHFGLCPRVHCNPTNVVPCGRSDLPGVDTVKLYCPNCCDIYTPASSRFQSVDGMSRTSYHTAHMIRSSHSFPLQGRSLGQHSRIFSFNPTENSHPRPSINRQATARR